MSSFVDMFSAIDSQEAALRESFERDCATLKASLAVFSACEALRSSPGYKEFRLAVEKLAQTCLHGLESASSGLDNDGLREAIGGYRMLRAVAKMLDGNERHLKMLADRLASVEAEYARRFTDTGRAKPTSSWENET